VSLASCVQETLKRVGVMALKFIKLWEELKHSFPFFFGGGSVLNTVLVGKRHCTTTSLQAPVFNCDSCSVLSTSRYLPGGDDTGSEIQAGRGSSLS